MDNTNIDPTQNSPAENSRVEHAATFRDAGVVRLPGVIEASTIDLLRAQLWEEIDRRFDIRFTDRNSWFANPHNPMGDARAKRLSGMNPVMAALEDSGRLSPIETAIQREIDALFGAGRWEPLDRWYSLLTFPGTEVQWTVPHNSWHNDEPIVVGDHEPWSLFVFVFLDTVDRDTGPTIAVTGSHRRGELIARKKGVRNEREVRAFATVTSGLFPEPGELQLLPVGQLLGELVATDEWFADLVSSAADDQRTKRLTQDGTTFHSNEDSAQSHEGPAQCNEVAAQSNDVTTIHNSVLCLSADVGDIIIFDPRSLHSVSPNISDRPRQVLRIDFRRTPANKL